MTVAAKVVNFQSEGKFRRQADFSQITRFVCKEWNSQQQNKWNVCSFNRMDSHPLTKVKHKIKRHNYANDYAIHCRRPFFSMGLKWSLKDINFAASWHEKSIRETKFQLSLKCLTHFTVKRDWTYITIQFIVTLPLSQKCWSTVYILSPISWSMQKLF